MEGVRIWQIRLIRFSLTRTFYATLERLQLFTYQKGSLSRQFFLEENLPDSALIKKLADFCC